MKLLLSYFLLLLILLTSCQKDVEQSAEETSEDSIFTSTEYPLGPEDERFNKSNSVLISFSKSDANNYFSPRNRDHDSLAVEKTDSIIEINYYKMLGGSPTLKGDCKLVNDSLQVTYWYELDCSEYDMPSVISSYKLTYKIIPTSFKGIKVEQLSHHYSKKDHNAHAE